ncbi:SRPBCC family protein [Mycolicibacter kumamotonensis]|uniref:SRPBCC family protein n=1 Tax=Mycolicibacter kumamotonensis TaxID=354243 RepID=A0A1B8SI40_9MYCO|nr:SRPBCC family protein [Mycolicibacter kumamotonensis]OBY32379.1 hypothetical protein ACT18_07755 [Mycolicibacter kumamotonensis]
MTILTASGAIDLPATTVFDYASDYRRMPDWVFGLQTVEPLGSRSAGLGAEFRGTGKVGPISMTGTGCITGWEPGRLITVSLATHNGIEVSATVATTGEWGTTSTQIALTAEYRFPGGIAGKLLQRSVEPMLGAGIRYTERTLRRQCLRVC